MSLMSTLRTLYWTWHLRRNGARVGKNFVVQGPIEILLRDGGKLSNVTIGDNVTFTGKTYLRIRKEGKVTVEDGVRLGTDVWLVGANDATLSVGENTVLGSYSIFNGGHGIRIGSHCVFAAFVYVNSSDHNFKRGELVLNQGFSGAPIEIGNDVWLGGHVFVNKGVTIGEGTIVGAGAVVTKDIPSYKIAVGNPAQVLMDRE
ncbi:MAG: acyltransferase [Thermodesulfobacteriota bacterium]